MGPLFSFNELLALGSVELTPKLAVKFKDIKLNYLPPHVIFGEAKALIYNPSNGTFTNSNLQLQGCRWLPHPKVACEVS